VHEPPGCPGGNGGKGGAGGHGGGGAGGIVVAVLHKAGTLQGDDRITVTSGSFGAGGKGDPEDSSTNGTAGDTARVLDVVLGGPQ